MGSHCSFGHLKHKLWPKEGPGIKGVKLAVWLPTTKSRQSTSSRCPIRKCNTALKSSRRELQLCFRLHHNLTLQSGDIGVQSSGTPTGTTSGLHFGSPGKKSNLDASSAARCRVYYKGEGGGFPQVWAVVSLVCPCCPWLVLAPKVLQLCTNHFVWVVWRSVWVNKLVNSS
jgi:hypothetical protein